MFLLLTTALKGTAKLARYFGKRQKSELRNTHTKVNDLNCYHIKAPCGSTKTRLNYNNVFNIFFAVNSPISGHIIGNCEQSSLIKSVPVFYKTLTRSGKCKFCPLFRRGVPLLECLLIREFIVVSFFFGRIHLNFIRADFMLSILIRYTRQSSFKLVFITLLDLPILLYVI